MRRLSALLCHAGRHQPSDAVRWNQGYGFTTCTRCGVALVRSMLGDWHVPKHHRVVWRAAGDTPVEPREVPPPVVDSPVVHRLAMETPADEPIAVERPATRPIVVEPPISKPVAVERPVNPPIAVERPVARPIAVERPIRQPVGIAARVNPLAAIKTPSPFDFSDFE